MGTLIFNHPLGFRYKTNSRAKTNSARDRATFVQLSSAGEEMFDADSQDMILFIKPQRLPRRIQNAMAQIYPEHEHLKLELRLRGISMRKIALEMGVLPGSVSAVSQGRRRSRRIEAAIAHALDRRVEDVFPDRYHKETTMK